MSDSQPNTRGWAPRFFTIWVGQQLSLIGSTLAQFALVWWLTRTTGSATVLAISVAIATLPNILLGPFVGALVDRWSRRLILIFADGTVALASALLAVLFWSGAIHVWQVYLILLVRALGTTFHWPAMAATTPLMVPDKHLPRVAGLNQALGGAVDILAPPLGALLLGVTALYNIMLIDVITAALAILPLLFIAVPQPPRLETGQAIQTTIWTDMRLGFHYVWGWSGLRALILYSLILNLIVNPPMELLPLLVTQHFNGQALQLGWLSSAWGFGILAGGLLLSVWGGFRRRVVTMLMGVTGLGVGVLLVGLTPAVFFPLALAGMFFGALMNAMSNASLFTILQSTVTPDMQGRVFALGRSLATASIPLGMLVAGPLTDQVGVRALFLGAGIIYIFLGVGAFFIQPLMELEEQGGAHLASAV